MKRWYLAHTLPRAEYKASVHLTHQAFAVYLPRYLARRSHARRRDWVRKPLFPGYLFVQLDLGLDRWRAVYSTVGVRTLVGPEDRPLTVPGDVIEEIQAREDGSGHVVLGAGRVYRRGDRVRFTEGPFLDSTGIFERRSDQERVVILLDLLGRQVRVSASPRAIMPCA